MLLTRQIQSHISGIFIMRSNTGHDITIVTKGKKLKVIITFLNMMEPHTHIYIFEN